LFICITCWWLPLTIYHYSCLLDTLTGSYVLNHSGILLTNIYFYLLITVWDETRAYDTYGVYCSLQASLERLIIFTFHINFMIKDSCTYCDGNCRVKLYQLHFKATVAIPSKQYTFTATAIVSTDLNRLLYLNLIVVVILRLS
jgi:hypothetical protein